MSDEIARCFILASMKNVLQQQHSHFETERSIIHNLSTEIFDDQTRQAKQAAIWKLMNCWMRPRTLVRVYMLEVITVLNDIEIMEALIDEENQVDIALETLSDSFDTFKLNYVMNKLNYNLTELMKEL